MTKPLLEAGKHGGFITGLDIDDATGQQAGLGERGRKEILPGAAAEHLALGPRCNAGGKKRRRPVNRPIPSTRNLMQRPERQPSPR